VIFAVFWRKTLFKGIFFSVVIVIFHKNEIPIFTASEKTGIHIYADELIFAFLFALTHTRKRFRLPYSPSVYVHAKKRRDVSWVAVEFSAFPPRKTVRQINRLAKKFSKCFRIKKVPRTTSEIEQFSSFVREFRQAFAKDFSFVNLPEFMLEKQKIILHDIRLSEEDDVLHVPDGSLFPQMEKFIYILRWFSK